jgi:hypothetical protein
MRALRLALLPEHPVQHLVALLAVHGDHGPLAAQHDAGDVERQEMGREENDVPALPEHIVIVVPVAELDESPEPPA